MPQITVTVTTEEQALVNAVEIQGLQRWVQDAVQNKITSAISQVARFEAVKLLQEGGATMPVDELERARQFLSRP